MATTNSPELPTASAGVLPGRARQREHVATACLAVVALVLWAAPVAAQSRGAQVTARLGIAAPDDAYQVNCGHASIALGVDVQGRRQLFPQLSVDHFTGSGGGDVACIPIDPARGTAVGGLQLDGATRLGLGVGARVRGGPVQFEGEVLGGVIRGRRGYTQGAADDHHGVMPHVGGQASLVFFRWIVLSAATHWTRLTLNVVPVAGGAPSVRTSWSPMTTGQIGVRIGAGGAGRRH